MVASTPIHFFSPYIEDIIIYRGFLEVVEANKYFEYLLANINWENERITPSGEVIKIKRKMAYHCHDGLPYEYANLRLVGNKFDTVLLHIKDKIEDLLNSEFNSVLLNLYENGKDEIRWHSDKEPQLGPHPLIPCLNLGVTRTFWFLHKETGVRTPLAVSNGDLLVMLRNCQQNYLHAVLKEPEVKTTRISLTYRYVYDNADKPESKTNS